MQLDHAQIDSAMQQAVGDGVFPAAELLVGTPTAILHHQHYGDCSDQSIFDLASLTKIICTTTLAMIAVAEGKLQLTDLLTQHLTIPQDPTHQDIRLYHLLQHSSGLPAHRPYYAHMPAKFIGTNAGYAWTIKACAQEPCEAAAGECVVYSDIGFILLGRVLENLWQTDLNSLYQREVAVPFGLSHTHFRPNRTNTLDNYLPTQACPWRQRIIRGESRDENCFAMGGVAGHAGLFGNASDLHCFAQQIVAATQGAHDILNPSVVQNFIQPTTPAPHIATRRVLGWDRSDGSQSSAGRYVSSQTIGHLAYTGCSLWIDLEKKIWVVLLSNRTHPSVDNDKIKSFRPKIHDLILK